MAKRFIYHGGSREKNDDGSTRKRGIAHNGAFFKAAVNVKNDYSDFKKIGVMKKITNAASIVKDLNKEQKNTIKSLDILSHGTQVSLNFSEHDDKNCGFVTEPAVKLVWNLYARTDDNVNEFEATSRFFTDMSFDNFVDDARIQFHGCTTAGKVELNGTVLSVDNIAIHLSKKLFESGKTKSYYIGHTTKISPMIRGKDTTIDQQDYRHGERVVVHNGKTILTTKKKGLLRHEEILKLI